MAFALVCIEPLHGFVPLQPGRHAPPCLSAEADSSPRMGEMTPPEKRVYELLTDMHDSNYSFRLVVVGKGAILETTASLGPVVKVTQAPSTGANMMTMASEDQSFEFHVRLSEVSKMVLTSKETPIKTLRLARLLNTSGDSMCSIILADSSDEAIEWFEGMVSKYGSEIQL